MIELRLKAGTTLRGERGRGRASRNSRNNRALAARPRQRRKTHEGRNDEMENIFV
jgi:hypothetical protein